MEKWIQFNVDGGTHKSTLINLNHVREFHFNEDKNRFFIRAYRAGTDSYVEIFSTTKKEEFTLAVNDLVSFTGAKEVLSNLLRFDTAPVKQTVGGTPISGIIG